MATNFTPQKFVPDESKAKEIAASVDKEQTKDEEEKDEEEKKDDGNENENVDDLQKL